MSSGRLWDITVFISLKRFNLLNKLYGCYPISENLLKGLWQSHDLFGMASSIIILTVDWVSYWLLQTFSHERKKKPQWMDYMYFWEHVQSPSWENKFEYAWKCSDMIRCCILVTSILSHYVWTHSPCLAVHLHWIYLRTFWKRTFLKKNLKVIFMGLNISYSEISE